MERKAYHERSSFLHRLFVIRIIIMIFKHFLYQILPLFLPNQAYNPNVKLRKANT